MEEDRHADMKAALRHKRKEPAHIQRDLAPGTIFWGDVVILATNYPGTSKRRGTSPD